MKALISNKGLLNSTDLFSLLDKCQTEWIQFFHSFAWNFFEKKQWCIRMGSFLQKTTRIVFQHLPFLNLSLVGSNAYTFRCLSPRPALENLIGVLFRSPVSKLGCIKSGWLPGDSHQLSYLIFLLFFCCFSLCNLYFCLFLACCNAIFKAGLILVWTRKEDGDCQKHFLSLAVPLAGDEFKEGKQSIALFRLSHTL